uniref:Centromere protein S n=1 Tax=Mesocestoides corti TaxID=53468 RepID=A0A5K3EZK9_MESCO
MLASDLEAFAHHAKRSTITVDDVSLFVRRNPHLRKFLEEKSAELDATDENGEDITDESDVVEPRKKKRQQRLPSTSARRKSTAKPGTTPITTLFETIIVSSPRKEDSSKSPLTPTASTPKDCRAADRPTTSGDASRSPELPGESLAVDIPTTTATATGLDDDEFSNIFDEFDDL